MTERVVSTAAGSDAEPERRRGGVLVVVILVAMALVTVLVLGGSYALHADDRSHVISVACTVTAAEGDVGSRLLGQGDRIVVRPGRDLDQGVRTARAPARGHG